MAMSSTNNFAACSASNAGSASNYTIPTSPTIHRLFSQACLDSPSSLSLSSSQNLSALETFQKTKEEVSNVKVAVRFKPVQSGAQMAAYELHGDQTVVLVDNFRRGEDYDNFVFDRCFGCDAEQEQVYKYLVEEMVDEVVRGYNATLLAYGQTGAGKTYTMFGPIIADNAGLQRTLPTGVIPHAIRQLFTLLTEDKTNADFEVTASFLEIYREELLDLLRPGPKLKIRESPLEGITVDKLHREPVTGYHDILNLIAKGENNRHVAHTDMNEVSSRSHSLLTMDIEQRVESGAVRRSKFHFADLAGSERVGKTGAEGQILEEAKKINQSLSALGNCIYALTERGRKHIPFRDSKLTFLLSDSLGGNSKTALIIACSSNALDLDETLSSLRFGSRAKRMKNAVHINQMLSREEMLRQLKVAQHQNDKMKKDIDLLQQQIQKLKEYNAEDVNACCNIILTREQQVQTSIDGFSLLRREIELENQIARLTRTLAQAHRAPFVDDDVLPEIQQDWGFALSDITTHHNNDATLMETSLSYDKAALPILAESNITANTEAQQQHPSPSSSSSSSSSSSPIPCACLSNTQNLSSLSSSLLPLSSEKLPQKSIYVDQYTNTDGSFEDKTTRVDASSSEVDALKAENRQLRYALWMAGGGFARNVMDGAARTKQDRVSPILDSDPLAKQGWLMIREKKGIMGTTKWKRVYATLTIDPPTFNLFKTPGDNKAKKSLSLKESVRIELKISKGKFSRRDSISVGIPDIDVQFDESNTRRSRALSDAEAETLAQAQIFEICNGKNVFILMADTANEALSWCSAIKRQARSESEQNGVDPSLN